MQVFKDAEGVEWGISLNVDAIRKVREQCQVDLHKLDESSLQALIEDDEKLVDVLHEVLKSQAEKRDLDATGFASRLIGPAIDRAADALMEELVFISRSGKAQILGALWQKIKAADELRIQSVMSKLESGVIEQMMMDQIEKTLTKS